jgi:hypothetical protein
MTQIEIKQKSDEIRERLKAFRKKTKRQERDIIEEWEDLQEKCSHPNKQGKSEGYCPDCGWTFG